MEAGSGRLFSGRTGSMSKTVGEGCGEVVKRQGVQFCQVSSFGQNRNVIVIEPLLDCKTF